MQDVNPRVGVAVQQVSKKYGGGSYALDDVSLEIRAGELLALLGPSGSGKTTLLNVLAGLESVDQGRITFGDVDVTRMPAEDRHVGVVFQSSMLYPHLTLRDSIAFGPRLAGVARAEVARRTAEVTEWLHIDHLLDRRPHQVSGGERQRAAIAKALVARPALLLMDEPFSAVDAQLRRQLRTELVRLHREFATTTVFVTHDQEEAMGIADRVAVMRSGQPVQIAEPLALYREPTNAWLADFVGTQPLNLLRVRNTGGGRLAAFDGDLVLQSPLADAPGEFDLGVRPEDIVVLPGRSESHAQVFTREVIGSQVKYTLRTKGGGEIVAIDNADQALGNDAPVDLSVRWDRALVFDPTTGTRITVAPALGAAGEPVHVP